MNTPTELIRLDTPFWARMQNFVFLPCVAEPEWTTNSETPLEKIVRVINKTPKMAKTRRSGKIQGKGQLVQLNEVGKLVAGDEGLMSYAESYNLEGVPAYGLVFQQGLDQDAWHIYTVFGNASSTMIEVFKHNFKGELIESKMLWFSEYGQWYHRSWEPEGIRVHPITGEVWIGINFPTFIGTHTNYITKIDF